MRNKRARLLRKAAASIAKHNESETKQAGLLKFPTGKVKEDGVAEMVAIPTYNFRYLKGSFKMIYKALKKNWIRHTRLKMEIV
jgi:hypothetical protein